MKIFLALLLATSLGGCALFTGGKQANFRTCDPMEPYNTGAIPQHSRCSDGKPERPSTPTREKKADYTPS